MKKKTVLFIFETISIVLSAVIGVAVIFTVGFRLTTVDGRSMEPTLQDGDRLLVAGRMTEYDFGDIVVVVEPNEELMEPIIKRVIASEGQWVDVRYDEGLVYVGDTKETMIPIDEPYTASLTNRRPSEDLNEYPVQVPENQYFCMGDNRNHSTDSRSYRVGFIQEGYILGKALLRFMPFGDYNIYE